MKKTIAMVMAVLLMVSMLAGCGAGGNDKNEKGQTVISIGSWPTSEGKEMDALVSRKNRFEEANPDAVIEPDTWKFDRKTFYAKAAGGTLPTVYYSGYTEMPEIISANYAADLTDALYARGYEGMINESVLAAITNEKGRIMGYPTGSYLLGLAFNAELFEKAGLLEADGTPKQPKDWYEVAEFAVKIKEATGKAGIVLPTAEGSGGWIFTSIAWSFGADFMEKDENGKWKATFNSPEAAEALQWFKDLRWKYDVFPSNILLTAEEWYKSFGIGAAGMTVTAGDYPGKVVKYGMKPNQIGMMAMPAGPKRHVTLLGGELQCVNSNATKDQIEAAIGWMETAYNYNLTDEFKKTTEETVQTQLEQNQHVGIKSMSIWSAASESVKWYNDYIDAHANANQNHVKLYNEFVANCPIEVQPEEPVCAQQLYGVLSGCIQEVLTNKDADVKAVLEKANSDFQIDYLDNM